MSVNALLATCTDTDGGKNYFLKGTVSINNKNPQTDYCEGINNYGGFTQVQACSGPYCFLREKFCFGNGISEEDYKCPSCNEGACKKLEVTTVAPNAFIMQNDGSFGYSDNGIDAFGALAQLYQSVEDKYDFVAIFTTSKNGADIEGQIRNDIKGIGLSTPFDYSSQYGLSNKKLKGFTVTNDIDKYVTKYKDIEPLLFESYHYWIMYLGDQYDCDETNSCKTGLKINIVGHWSPLMDISTKENGKVYIDPGGASIWQDNNDGTFTYLGSGSGINGDTARFMDLSLYLMGFLPPSQVKPATLFVPSEPVPKQFSTNDIGRKFKGTKKYITVNDLIQLGGTRVPDSVNSQKDFSMAFVLVLNNTKPTDAQIQKIVSESKNFPIDWNKATKGLSTINKAVSTVSPAKKDITDWINTNCKTI